MARARGEMLSGSDVDILVEIPRDISILDFVRIKQEVRREALGQDVRIYVEYDALKPRLRDGIAQNEQVSIL